MRGFFVKKTKPFVNEHGEIEQKEFLEPHDEETRKYIHNRKDGQVIVSDIKMARNYENHKRFFSMLNAAFDMQEFYSEFEVFRNWITVASGWFNIMVYPDGTTQLIPKSISFENMDELEFRKLFKTAIGAFLEEFGQGMTDDEFMRIIDYD